MNPLMQISEVSVKVCFVGPPCQSIYSRCGVFLEFEERLTKQIDADVVEERSELLLFPSPCDFPYAFQRSFNYPQFGLREVISSLGKT